jgi:hypothetical protein
MSQTQKDRKIQSFFGKELSVPRQNLGSNGYFAQAIAGALRREYRGRQGAVKIVSRLTGANERAVKNWFDGKNGPSGENLVVLVQHSTHVLETFLLLAARGELVTLKRYADIRIKLKEISVLIDEL